MKRQLVLLVRADKKEQREKSVSSCLSILKDHNNDQPTNTHANVLKGPSPTRNIIKWEIFASSFESFAFKCRVEMKKIVFFRHVFEIVKRNYQVKHELDLSRNETRWKEFHFAALNGLSMPLALALKLLVDEAGCEELLQDSWWSSINPHVASQHQFRPSKTPDGRVAAKSVQNLTNLRSLKLRS